MRIIDVKLRQDWAWNMMMPLKGSLPEDFPVRRVINIPLDDERMVAALPRGVELPCHPFFGVMGVSPPPEWGPITSIVPQPHGSNLDIKELGPGSTLYLPVFVPGADFQTGDGHALQEVTVRLPLGCRDRPHRDLRVPCAQGPLHTMPRAETDTHYITIGIDQDLDDAAKQGCAR